jgi:hypothetical protein
MKSHDPDDTIETILRKLRSAGPPAPPSGRPLSFVERVRQADAALPERPNLPSLKDRPPSFVELLRQGQRKAEEQRADPMWRATLETIRNDPTDRPLRTAVADLLTHTLASGRNMISGREIFWRLRVPPNREVAERLAIARVLRSLGWVRVRYGPQNKRIWGWRWREWNVSHVKVDLGS